MRKGKYKYEFGGFDGHCFYGFITNMELFKIAEADKTSSAIYTCRRIIYADSKEQLLETAKSQGELTQEEEE